MWVLVVILVTASGMAVPTSLPVFTDRDKCHMTGMGVSAEFAARPEVKSVRYVCRKVTFPNAKEI